MSALAMRVLSACLIGLMGVSCAATSTTQTPATDNSAATTPETKPKPPIVESSLGGSVVWLEDTNRAQLAEIDEGLVDNVPADAERVFIFSTSTIDGTISFLRFDAGLESARSVCGELCTSEHAVTSFPELWPTKDELRDYPPWFPSEPVGSGYTTYLTIGATPHFSETVDGEEEPCGYSRVRGELWAHHGETGSIFQLQVSLQWFRTGCGA